ncbi:MAG: ribosomal protein [Deltaproteobacteria bacterium]|jgi:large subunit ribosomal protein L9|nr:ribosomal protein [Deltaproteobacteria bacterium]
MKVILTEDIPKLGKTGDTVEVARGYGRNYLVPQGKALLASSKNVKALEHKRRLLRGKAEMMRKDAEGLAEKIKGITVNVARKVVEEGKLYGSVTVSDLLQALEQRGVVLERKQIKLDEPIKALGEYKVTVKYHADVEAELTVQVVEETS